MRTIRVDHNYANIRSYKSASEAIRAESDNPRHHFAIGDSQKISESRIAEYSSDGQSILLYLSNGTAVSLAAENRSVSWQTLSWDREKALPACEHPEAMQLAWPNGDITKSDPSKLLESRQGFSVRKLTAGECLVSLHFKGGGALQFIPLWNRSEETPMLYVSELEEIPRRGGDREMSNREA